MFDLNKNEEEVLRYWSENSILEKTRAKNKGKKPFYFLDGPPYASGELHPGQIWVKDVKDILLRYRRMNGWDVHDRAGYDVHGLPIENKVEKELKLGSKKEIESIIGVENFIKRCKEFVDALIPNMKRDYERFGVSLDLDNPYYAYKRDFIESGWTILKKTYEKGLLYQDLKSMLYCTHCETVLAQGTLEVSYSDEKDPAIFVAFKVDAKASKPTIKIDENTYLLIWTTTPWTIPANIAVAVNPKVRYVKARISNKSLIIAQSRLDAVVDVLGESAVVESEFYGSELEGIKYLSPLEDQIPKQKEFRKFHKVIFEEGIVSSTEGSGLVHIAPGHGAEDYAAGKKNKLPIFVPLDMHAHYTSDAGTLEGIAVPGEANEKVLSYLKTTGALLDVGTVVHSYPHCWRCNNKLIMIGTHQWFLNVQKVKKKIIRENRKVSWHPVEAQAWMEDVLQNSPDWCFSRQRYWGTPIPIWECEKCKHIEVIGSVEELSQKAHNKEAVAKLHDLHRPYVDAILLDCPKCKGSMRRINDVADVWFDASIAFVASLSKEEFDRLFPAAFILEGKDQLRGWFSVLLKSSVMVYGKTPFKNVVIDGMLLAEDGREMHKSLGNYISLKELLTLTSADAYRLWVSSHTQWLDLQFKKDEIKEASKKINILYNVFQLFEDYASAIDYKANQIKKPRINEKSNLEDVWIVSRLNSTLKAATESLEKYEVQVANNALGEFCLNDLSRFYLKIAKKRIIDGSRSEAKKTLDLINYLLYTLISAYSPFIPFTSEYLYLKYYKKEGSTESIFLNDWPKTNKKLINVEVEAGFELAMDSVTAILSSREKANIKLRQPLSKATLEVHKAEAEQSLQRFARIVEDYTNLKHLEVKRTESFEVEIRRCLRN